MRHKKIVLETAWGKINKMVKKDLLIIIFLILILSSKLFSSKARAWGGEAHQYMCPKNQLFDCTEADQLDFKKSYPHGEQHSWGPA